MYIVNTPFMMMNNWSLLVVVVVGMCRGSSAAHRKPEVVTARGAVAARVAVVIF